MEVELDRLLRYDLWGNIAALESLRRTDAPPDRALKIMAHIAATHELWLSRIESGGPVTVWPAPDLDQIEASRLASSPFCVPMHASLDEPRRRCYDVYIMMSKTQIAFDPELLQRARQRAARLGISLAEYVRRLVARDLHEPRPPADSSTIFDLGRSGGSDVARDKDAMLGEAAAAERPPRNGAR